MSNLTTQTKSSLKSTQIFSADDVQRTLKRLTHEMLEQCHGAQDLVLMGIITRGAYLADRVCALVGEIEGIKVPSGHLDITLYRDDAAQSLKPAGESTVPVDLTGKTVVLVDDVLNSGRTVRAALDALNAYGRPARVQLMVLLDRGHRELPIRADYVGKNIPTSFEDRVTVRLTEVDGNDDVVLEQE